MIVSSYEFIFLFLKAMGCGDARTQGTFVGSTSNFGLVGII